MLEITRQPGPKGKAVKGFSGTHYLSRRLALFGVEDLPRGALRALADAAISLAQGLGRQNSDNENPNVTRMLDGQAANVAALLNDKRDEGGRPLVYGQLREELVSILAQHGVKVPPPDAVH